MAGSMVPRDIACMAWLLYKKPQMTQMAVQLVRFYCLTEHVTENMKKRGEFSCTASSCFRKPLTQNTGRLTVSIYTGGSIRYTFPLSAAQNVHITHTVSVMQAISKSIGDAVLV